MAPPPGGRKGKLQSSVRFLFLLLLTFYTKTITDHKKDRFDSLITIQPNNSKEVFAEHQVLLQYCFTSSGFENLQQIEAKILWIEYEDILLEKAMRSVRILNNVSAWGIYILSITEVCQMLLRQYMHHFILFAAVPAVPKIL